MARTKRCSTASTANDRLSGASTSRAQSTSRTRSMSGALQSEANYEDQRRRNLDIQIVPRQMPQPPPDDDRFYVIEKLLEKRFNEAGCEEYLVRWLNYPPEYDTWEPRSMLEQNSLDMVLEFNRIEREDDANELHCICRQPYRFHQGGMIQCFNCRTWYHFKCLSMNMEEANSYEYYYCHSCRAMNPELKNVIKQSKLNSIYGHQIPFTSR